MNADTTRRPEAERAYLAGLLELVTDNPPRCREAAALVEPIPAPAEATPPTAGRGDHQTRQAATPLWRWQMAS